MRSAATGARIVWSVRAPRHTLISLARTVQRSKAEGVGRALRGIEGPNASGGQQHLGRPFHLLPLLIPGQNHVVTYPVDSYHEERRD
jgi:hypothetical protein